MPNVLSSDWYHVQIAMGECQNVYGIVRVHQCSLAYELAATWRRQPAHIHSGDQSELWQWLIHR